MSCLEFPKKPEPPHPIRTNLRSELNFLEHALLRKFEFCCSYSWTTLVRIFFLPIGTLPIPSLNCIIVTIYYSVIRNLVLIFKSITNVLILNFQEESSVVFVNDDVTITKNTNSKKNNLSSSCQNQSIELENLGKVFRNGCDRENSKLEDISIETNSNFSDDEEYTPKKQRMSRYKQEPFKCDISGCGKIYKYVSHYRHHQDSHKLMMSPSVNVSPKSPKLKQGKASTVSFYQ